MRMIRWHSPIKYDGFILAFTAMTWFNPLFLADQYAFTNSAYTNETSNKDLHCLPVCYWFFIETPIHSDGRVQIQGWKMAV